MMSNKLFLVAHMLQVKYWWNHSARLNSSTRGNKWWEAIFSQVEMFVGVSFLVFQVLPKAATPVKLSYIDLAKMTVIYYCNIIFEYNLSFKRIITISICIIRQDRGMVWLIVIFNIITRIAHLTEYFGLRYLLYRSNASKDIFWDFKISAMYQE